MSSDPAAADWMDANQQVLAAELAWLRARLAPDDTAATAPDALLEEARKALPSPSAIDLLTDAFGLSPFERHVLLLCAGVELDAGFAAACAHLHGGALYVTFGLALSMLPEPHWSALTPARPLRRWQLVELEPGSRLVERGLRIDERVLHYLTGINHPDTRLQSIASLRPPPDLVAAAHDATAGRIAAVWSSGATRRVVQLTGDDRIGQEDVGAAAAGRLGLRLMVMKQADLPAAHADTEALLTLCEREARLLPAALLVQCDDDTPGLVLRAITERGELPLVVAARDPLRVRRDVLTFEVNKPEPDEQKQLWLSALGERAATLNGALDAVVTQFRLSATTIATVAASMAEGDSDTLPPGRRLWHACRRVERARLDDLAERIVPSARWDDLVLPDTTLSVLRQIAAHVRQRACVHGSWGFAAASRRGIGISALFSGESGTGKTLASEVLSNELGLDLYRIDLSTVVSKYIGETEKNLRRVFDAAEDGGSILLFDEADALFGKRSEVKDSHDRYANIEISYLLQRMETYRGLAILTTNMKTALDRAFQRRLRFVVAFAFPDHALREAIWRRVFPPATPTADLDYRALARLNLPGGNIRNIALNAAFLAADSNAAVGMPHLLAAARAESAKLERPLNDAETRGWV